MQLFCAQAVCSALRMAYLIRKHVTFLKEQSMCKIMSMINFSISLCGYLIIVPPDCQRLLLNIKMQGKRNRKQNEGKLALL